MRRGNERVVSKACDIRTHGTFCKNFFVSFFGVKKSRERKFVLTHGKSERKVRKGNLLAKVNKLAKVIKKAHNFQTTLYQSISKLL